jgi:hypothetical protein
MDRLQFFPRILNENSSSSSEDERERNRRVVKQRKHFFDEYTDTRFRNRFRMNKETVLILAALLNPDLEPTSRRNKPISKLNQILICLSFYATGSFQSVVGDVFDISQATVSRIVSKVTTHIASLAPQFIQMPDNNAEKRHTAEKFHLISGFPLVIGALDCTHVKMLSPGGNNAEVFRNRKDYFSINVQVIGDANLKIVDIVSRWPGSVHDTTIFNDSHIRARFENNEFSPYHLLGDSGYPCRGYLLTPILRPDPNNHPHNRYNRAQIATRNSVERLFGVWKRRFPCIAFGLRLKPRKVCKIIVATAVLHNMCLRENDDWEDFDEIVPDDDSSDDEHFIREAQRGGENSAVRRAIINSVFTY